MRAVITGGTGFIGSWLAGSLLAEGWEVATVARGSGGERLGVEHYAVSVEDTAVRGAIRPGDVVVHLAALGSDGLSFSDPFSYGRTNAFGTLNVLEGCRLAGARFVLVSTQRVYASHPGPLDEDSALDPQSPYGYSKVAAETWARMYGRLCGVPVVILRVFSAYGPGQLVESGTSGVVSIFTRRALAGEELIVHGCQYRDFVYVSDVAKGIRAAMTAEAGSSPVYNIGSGVKTSLGELALAVKQAAGSRSRIVSDLEHPDRSCYVADIQKARRELGYEPQVALMEGLGRYIKWLAGR